MTVLTMAGGDGGKETETVQRLNQDKQSNDLTLSSSVGCLPLLRRTFA